MDRRKSILLIDDLPENLRLLVSVLQREGYRVQPTRTGERGLAIARTEAPDLILLDINMPELDGFEVCRRLKSDERTRDIPVIFLSALDDTTAKVRGFQVGAVDYVTKPIEEAELLARVNTHVMLRSLLQNEMEMDRHRSMAHMVAGVAHELNTPLGIAYTAADMIAKRLQVPQLDTLLTSEPTLARNLHKMRQAADLLMRNVANAHKLVQNFKQISINQLTQLPEQVTLTTTVREIIDLYMFDANAVKLEVAVCTLLEDEEAVWCGYPGHLTHILLNLFSNVERYAYPDRDQGRLEIEIADVMVDQQPGYALIVRDWGRGIAPDDLPHVFDPFFTTGRMHGGTGLGMAIVHHLVTTVLRGHLHIESTQGEGTAVHISFPKVLGDTDEAKVST